MKKICAVLGIVVFILSCKSADIVPPPTMADQNTKGHWIIRPMDNAVIIIGVSSPMRKRDEEVDSAKEDAAKKAAMYYDVYGKIETPTSEGGSFFENINDSRLEVVYNKNYKQYIDKLTYDPNNDVLITKEAVFIRFKLPAVAQQVKYTTKFEKDGSPVWVNNRQLPKVDGYISAVGFSQKQMRLKEAVYKATEAAVASMIETQSTKITESVVDKSVGTRRVSYSVSEGRLQNFHVIEIWVQPKTNNVYTLAIGKPVK